jgi:hypothetical protein
MAVSVTSTVWLLIMSVSKLPELEADFVYWIIGQGLRLVLEMALLLLILPNGDLWLFEFFVWAWARNPVRVIRVESRTAIFEILGMNCLFYPKHKGI